MVSLYSFFLLENRDKMSRGDYKKRAGKKKYTMGTMTRQGVEKSLSEVTAAAFKRNYPVPPTAQDTPLTHKVKMYHNSFYIAGETTRPLDQALFFCNICVVF